MFTERRIDNELKKAVIKFGKMFPVYRREMKGIDWGLMYRRHGSNGFLGKYDPDRLVDTLL